MRSVFCWKKIVRSDIKFIACHERGEKSSHPSGIDRKKVDINLIDPLINMVYTHNIYNLLMTKSDLSYTNNSSFRNSIIQPLIRRQKKNTLFLYLHLRQILAESKCFFFFFQNNNILYSIQ